jgi:sugar phosphate isomerase/epimerase
MDWDVILDAARRAGVAWNIVEQDGNFATDALESARAGAEFMAGRQA